MPSPRVVAMGLAAALAAWLAPAATAQVVGSQACAPQAAPTQVGAQPARICRSAADLNDLLRSPYTGRVIIPSDASWEMKGRDGQPRDLHPAAFGGRARRPARRARQPAAALRGLPRRGRPAVRDRGQRRARRGAASARSIPAQGSQAGAPGRARDRGDSGLRRAAWPSDRSFGQRGRGLQRRRGDRRDDRHGRAR